jgi:DnaJ-class molecular chaperone
MSVSTQSHDNSAPLPEKNYYQLLGVEKKSFDHEIAASFRKLAITLHPAKNIAQSAQYNMIFSEICEAYEVLSNPALRDIYDKYGESFLKNGIPDGRGNYKGGYQFSGDMDKIFEAYFGTANVHKVCLDEANSQMTLEDTEHLKARYTS